MPDIVIALDETPIIGQVQGDLAQAPPIQRDLADMPAGTVNGKFKAVLPPPGQPSGLAPDGLARAHHAAIQELHTSLFATTPRDPADPFVRAPGIVHVKGHQNQREDYQQRRHGSV